MSFLFFWISCIILIKILRNIKTSIYEEKIENLKEVYQEINKKQDKTKKWELETHIKHNTYLKHLILKWETFNFNSNHNNSIISINAFKYFKKHLQNLINRYCINIIFWYYIK